MFSALGQEGAKVSSFFRVHDRKQKPMKKNITANLRSLLHALHPFVIAVAVLWAVPRNAQAQVYVLEQGPSSNTDFVSEYSTKGELINANFITGLSATQIAVSGDNLFVVNFPVGTGGWVGKYDATTGAAINASFITALNSPNKLAVSNNSLFVSYNGQQGTTIAKYDATTGAAINPDFITGLNETFELAVLDDQLFVSTAKSTAGGFVFTIAKYDATTGAVIDAKFIKGLNLRTAKGNILYGTVGVHNNIIATYDATIGAPINNSLIDDLGRRTSVVALALLGDRLFVATFAPGIVHEYDATTGALIEARFLTVPSGLFGIAVRRPK
jgi:hypothetical protein